MMSRRRLIGGLAALSSLALMPAAARANLPERRLAFRNVHNGERFDARFFGAGGYDADGLAELNHALRDWRTGEVVEMDRALFDLLAGVRDRLGVAARRPFDLISGYRSPRTNGRLRQAGGAHSGVASQSQHLLGKATDIAMPGVALDRLRSAAMVAQRGGVGFYPRDGFVHVDTARVRYW